MAALQALGIRAGAIHSNLPPEKVAEVKTAIRNGALDLEWECADASCLQVLQDRLREPARGLAADALRIEGQHVHAHLVEGAR